jgi:hypothetical protein
MDEELRMLLVRTDRRAYALLNTLEEPDTHWWVITDDHNGTTVGTLTVHLQDGEYDGWDWIGDPGFVNADGTATDEMQELLDMLDQVYC